MPRPVRASFQMLSVIGVAPRVPAHSGVTHDRRFQPVGPSIKSTGHTLPPTLTTIALEGKIQTGEARNATVKPNHSPGTRARDTDVAARKPQQPPDNETRR